jgi:hypothetical protein
LHDDRQSVLWAEPPTSGRDSGFRRLGISSAPLLCSCGLLAIPEHLPLEHP